jgi:hypothetical protein
MAESQFDFFNGKAHADAMSLSGSKGKVCHGISLAFFIMAETNRIQVVLNCQVKAPAPWLTVLDHIALDLDRIQGHGEWPILG